MCSASDINFSRSRVLRIVKLNIGKVLKCPVAYFYAENDALANIIKLFSLINKDKQRRLINKLSKDIFG